VAAAAAGRPLIADSKRALILEEELALLGEEQADARQVDLLLVRFHLREIAAIREVPRQPAAPVFQVESSVAAPVDAR
jgi:hypothetical protein